MRLLMGAKTHAAGDSASAPRRAPRPLTLRARILLTVTALLAVSVVALTVVLSRAAYESALHDAETDGLVIASLLARPVEFATQLPNEVEDVVGQQMVVQATIAAHLVSLAEAAGWPPAAINARLREIVQNSALDEIWITDNQGHAYLRTEPDVDFTFSPDPAVQPQAHVFWPLLTGEKQSVVQETRKREVDDKAFKYAGVGGVDQPRIVQVGFNAEYLARLRERVGLGRLVDDLLQTGLIRAFRVWDENLLVLTYRGDDLGHPQALDDRDLARVQAMLADGRPHSYLELGTLTVLAPIQNGQDQIVGAVLVALSTDRQQVALRRQLLLGLGVAGAVLALGILASVLLARRVTEPVVALTAAAAAVEARSFDPAGLARVTGRDDELGQLARVFTHMAGEVARREQRLQEQVQALKIEIDERKKAREVAAITDTDYFQNLRQRARTLRARNEAPPA